MGRHSVSNRPGVACPTILQRVATLTVVATYILIVLGSTVRVTHSGMGCRSWPLCNGHLAPLSNFHSAMEQYHRYLATIVTVLVFYTGVLAWRHARHLRRVLVPALISCGVILAQVALGAITVLTHNAPVTVGMHLAMGVFELGIVTVVAVSAHGTPRGARQLSARFPGARERNVVRWGVAGVVAIFAIIVAGSVVVDSGAAKSCPSWPLCSLGTAPTHLVVIQLIHRAVVLVGGVMLLMVLVHAWRSWRLLGVGPLVILIAVTFAIQVLVGAASALLKAPPTIQDLHLVIAGILWMEVVGLATLSWVRESVLDSGVIDDHVESIR
ncbi:MAG: COX15/CtaA family protein [Ferrimicrobium sp.]